MYFLNFVTITGFICFIYEGEDNMKNYKLFFLCLLIAFLDVAIHSQDDKIRKVSEERIHQSLTIAQELGIRGVVFHANLIAGFYSEFYLQVFW